MKLEMKIKDPTIFAISELTQLILTNHISHWIERPSFPWSTLSKIETKISDRFKNSFKLTFLNLDIPYKIDHMKLNDPQNKIGIGFTCGAGSKDYIGQNSGSTIILIDQSIYKRITWRDIGINNKAAGLKRQANSKLIWYLNKFELPTTKIDEIGKRLMEEL